MIKLFTRNCFSGHVMLRSLCCELEAAGYRKVSEGTFLKVFKYRAYNSDQELFIADDPFAFLVGSVYFWRTSKKIYWMLELGAFQKAILSSKDLLRSLTFGFATWMSFFIASKVVLPSELRKRYLFNRYPYFKSLERSRVVFNRPVYSNKKGIVSDLIREQVDRIVSESTAVAIYSGAIQEGRDLEAIVDDSRKMGLALILCGPITSEDYINRIVRAGKIFYLGNLDECDLQYVYQNVSIGYVNYSNDILNTKLCAPVKIWDYRENGLYIFSNSNYGMIEEWCEFVDRFYGRPTSVVDSASLERLFSSKARGQFVGLGNNGLHNIFAS